MTGRIILLRHGQTFSNVERLLDTRPPGAELTERGREQATDVGIELAHLVAAGDGEKGRLRGIISSVALRAQQTSMLAARSFERTADLPEFSVDVDVRTGIHEVFTGEYEMSNSEDAHRGYSTALRGWLAGDAEACCPGGETYRDVLARYQSVLENVAAGLGDDDDVVVVSHGAAIRLVATHASNNIDGDFAFTGYLQNCRFVVLEPRGEEFGQWTVTRWADTEVD